jgi:hypothetical protein
MKRQNLQSQSKRVLASLAVATALAASSASYAETVSEGPSGGPGGLTFYDSAPALPSKINWIGVRHGQYVDAVQTWWSNGSVSPRHGGGGGGLDWFNAPAGELVNYVWGYSGSYVDSVGFCTSFRCSPRWGGNGGQYFSYQAPAGFEIAGFRGRSGAFVDAIGVIVRRR